MDMENREERNVIEGYKNYFIVMTLAQIILGWMGYQMSHFWQLSPFLLATQVLSLVAYMRRWRGLAYAIPMIGLVCILALVGVMGYAFYSGL